MDDWNGDYEEMLADEEFMVWLIAQNPDWDLEYTGDNVFAYRAWRAALSPIKRRLTEMRTRVDKMESQIAKISQRNGGQPS